MALDFFTAHSDYFEPLLEPDTRPSFAPGIASRSRDAAIIPKLDAYAAAHIPAEDRGDVVKAEARIGKTVKIRSARLPEIDAWLASKQAAPAAASAN
jgi:aminopeptidase N